MNGLGKSDESVVSKKPANEDLPLWAWTKEQAERRDSAKRNLDQDSTSRTQCRNHGVSPVLAWVRVKARQDKKAKFTSLYHHLDPSKLRHSVRAAEAGQRLRVWTAKFGKSSRSAGSAAQKPVRPTASRDLSGEACATGLHPEAGRSPTPLGIAALEDKIVQGAMVEVLNAVYEEDFLGFSYGFRPGRFAAPGVGRVGGSLDRKEGELGARPGRLQFLRPALPQLAGQVPATPDL
jgi:RNA-directed DNA polymerase